MYTSDTLKIKFIHNQLTNNLGWNYSVSARYINNMLYMLNHIKTDIVLKIRLSLLILKCFHIYLKLIYNYSFIILL